MTSATLFSLNLMNLSYALLPWGFALTLTIGGVDYILAAGLPSGRVSIDSNDPLGLGTVTMAGTTMDVYGANVQNPFMGNTYFVNRNTNWTFINYFISGVLPTGTSLSSVATAYTLKSGATISGAGATEVTATSYTFNFTIGKTLTVANGTESRTYDAELAVEGQSIVVKQTKTGTRNYYIESGHVRISNKNW